MKLLRYKGTSDIRTMGKASWSKDNNFEAEVSDEDAKQLLEAYPKDFEEVADKKSSTRASKELSEDE